MAKVDAVAQPSPAPSPADTAAFIASDRAGAMTATVANLSAGSITD